MGTYDPPSPTGAPISLSTKSAAAAPQLTSDMEMGSVANANAASTPPPPADEDMMHLARVGDIVGMEKLFEAGDCDATYTDDEGITPLHVRPPLYLETAC